MIQYFLGLVGFVFVFFVWRRQLKTQQISGKTVCITGGTQGIGLAVAKECVLRGAAKIIILARNEDRLQQISDELNSQMGKSVVVGVCCDVSSVKNTSDVFQSLLEGRKDVRTGELIPEIDVLICCAGVCVCDNFENLTPQEIANQIKVNLLGTLIPCNFMFKRWVSTQAKGCIVLIGSVASQVNMFGFTAYGATKFGIKGFWEALHMEAAPHEIHTLMVFPPNTDTPGLKAENKRKPKMTSLVEDAGGILSPEYVAKQIVDGVEYKKTRVTFGFTGAVLASATSGFQPYGGVLEVLQDFGLATAARILAVVMSGYWKWKIVKNHASKSN